MVDEQKSPFQFESSDWLTELKFRESHFKAIGKLAVEFSALEFFVSYYIWVLNNNQDLAAGKVMTIGLSVRRLLPIFSGLYKVRDNTESRNLELQSIVRRIDELRIRRNDMIHSIWNYDYAQNTATRVKAAIDKKGIVRNPTEVLSISQITEIGNDLTRVIHDLHVFMQGYQGTGG